MIKHKNKKQTNDTDKITVHVDRKPRTPHKPTVVHKNKKKYTRKGKQRNLRRRQDLQPELGE